MCNKSVKTVHVVRFIPLHFVCMVLEHPSVVGSSRRSTSKMFWEEQVVVQYRKCLMSAYDDL